ncbi:MAG: tetratricopeptide repeat protein [Oscillatoriales cyanobacterium]|nr:MAG: tetratricopeptide repeat protein [Oscillatoriales cyanobacterium]
MSSSPHDGADAETDPISFQERVAQLNTQIDQLTAANLDPITRDELALDILCDRDALQAMLKELAKLHQLEAAMVSQVDLLDHRLATCDSILITIAALPRWRETFDSSPSAWWWFPEAEDAKPRIAIRRRELFWRGVSVVSLLATASAASTILPVFSIGGFGLGEALASAGQVTGLAVLGRGVLTPEGTKALKRFCAKFSIPGKWYNEAIAAFAVTLGTLSMWAAQDGLPRFFNYAADQHYQRGELSQARINYQKTLSLIPSNDEASLGLGLVYESLGQLKEAGDSYRRVADQGDPVALIRLARVQFFLLLKLNRSEKLVRTPATSEVEALLKLALHRLAGADLSVTEMANQRYQIYRNLGWLRWWQRDYGGAESVLKRAIQEDESFPQQQLGTGLSHCLLAQIYREEKREAEAATAYTACVQKSRPETLAEYQWFFQVGQGRMATCIDTSAVMRGTSRDLIQKLPLCRDAEAGQSNPVAPDPTQSVIPSSPRPTAGPEKPSSP